ncbi:hypothetical protein GCM10025298_13490 [Natronobiforma cellulositropha]
MAVGGVAGCLEPPGASGAATGPESVFASFFTLADFARNVAGEELAVENAVPPERHGHGWEPRTSLVPDILESDAFVYLDVEGFQPWAETAAREIEREYEGEVALIDALAGIELLEYDGHDHGHTHDERIEDADVDELVVIDRADDEAVADAHYGHWHGSLPAVPLGSHVSLGAVFTDSDGVAFSLEGAYAFDARAEGGSDVLEIDSHGDHVHLRGVESGTTLVVFELREDGSVVWEAPPLEVAVGEADGADGAGGDGHGHGDGGYGHSHGDGDHGHSHGEYDAKFFSDPVLAQRGVANIRDGLIDLDPANEAVYEENAARYIERLEDLHERFERALAERDHDVVVLAGHDSFQYLGARYGFEIHTPVGLSPDAQPSSGEIAETVELIDEEGLAYVLWDYFDGDRLAEAIVAESSAEEALMVSPAESIVESWEEAGYGDYLGQMEEITLPALEKALGAQ